MSNKAELLSTELWIGQGFVGAQPSSGGTGNIGESAGMILGYLKVL